VANISFDLTEVEGQNYVLRDTDAVIYSRNTYAFVKICWAQSNEQALINLHNRIEFGSSIATFRT
jgi:hypothetical protein